MQQATTSHRMPSVTVSRVLLFAILGGGVVVAGWAWVTIHRWNRINAHFSAVVPGLTESEVVTALGQPDRVVGPGPSHWCDDEPVALEHASAQDRECDRQWQYEQPFLPACYSVCFGVDGHVRSTYEYVSP